MNNFTEQTKQRIRRLGRTFRTDLWRGDLAATIAELQQTAAFWKNEVKVGWYQPTAQDKLNTVGLFFLGWLLLILAMMVFAFFLLPLLLFTAFIRAVRCSFGIKP